MYNSSNIKSYFSDKKAYISSLKSDNPDNYYVGLSEQQISLIQSYFDRYSVYLFDKLCGGLRLNVPKHKVDKLIELKGEGDWEFAGMRDMGYAGATTCELGHPLRYVYLARNLSNNSYIKFGSTCVGDFFDLSEDNLKNLVKLKDTFIRDLKEIHYLTQNNLLQEHLDIECGKLGKYLRFLPDVTSANIMGSKFTWVKLSLDFINSKLPIPKSLLTELLAIDSDISKYLLSISSESHILKLEKLENMGFLENYILLRDYMLESDPEKLDLTYFSRRGIQYYTTEQLDLYVNLAEVTFNRVNKAIGYFVKAGILDESNITSDCLMSATKSLTDIDTKLNNSLLVLKNLFRNKFVSSNRQNYELIPVINESLDYLGRKENIELIIKAVNDKKLKEEEELKRNNEKLEKEKDIKLKIFDSAYDSLPYINVARDILNKWKYDYLSEKQLAVVTRTYNSILSEINKSSSNGLDDDNKRYSLDERSDISTKIYRLKNEVYEQLPDKVKGIIETIETKKTVSDKQIKYINDAYMSYIIGEDVTHSYTPIGGEEGNYKYRLSDRVDVSAKITRLEDPSIYKFLQQKEKDIIETIKKYKTVSEKQIRYLDTMYKNNVK